MKHELIGKEYTFEDGNRLEVVQMKKRDEGKILVTYNIHSTHGIPKKLVMNLSEFLGMYGHLFGLNEPPKL